MSNDATGPLAILLVFVVGWFLGILSADFIR